MAKKSRQTHKRSTSQTPPAPRRETEAFQPQMRDRHLLRSLAPVRRGVLDSVLDNMIRRPYLREVEDLRHAPARTRKVQPQGYKRDDGTHAGYGYVPVRPRMPELPARLRLSFHVPQKTVVCIRRQARRRVLFALQALGRGRGAKKSRRARWTAKSYIQCRGVR